MSVLHITQLKQKIISLFEGKVDTSDGPQANPDKEVFFLSRSLSAYCIHVLSGATVEQSSAAITDGSGDNGIDAIYFHETEKLLSQIRK